MSNHIQERTPTNSPNVRTEQFDFFFFFANGHMTFIVVDLRHRRKANSSSLKLDDSNVQLTLFIIFNSIHNVDKWQVHRQIEAASS